VSIPTEPLQALYHKHKGEPCILLANGSTLNNADFSLLPAGVVTIGMNASWTVHWPTYHVCLDRKQDEMTANMYARLLAQGKVPVGCKGPKVFEQLGKEGRLFTWGSWPTAYGAYSMPKMSRATRPGRQTALSFSTNIAEGIQLGLDGFGAVSYAALQVAVSLGFTTMFWLGLDLGLSGAHHHGWWPADEDRMKRQNTLFTHAETILEPLGIKSYVVGSPGSHCSVWPKVGFQEMLRLLKIPIDIQSGSLDLQHECQGLPAHD
jgi:hypothetical protein